jgi:hypothetical protein
VNDVGYELVISPTARRQLAEVLPESVAFAAYEFIIGPLLANLTVSASAWGLHSATATAHAAERTG